MESLKAIKKKYENPRIQKLSRNGIYGILTSRVYIGIREIQNNGNTEEVPAAWKPIITNKTFEQVRETLSGNGPGPRSPRHNYVFSGLIRCAKCDQKLQGKSGKSRSGQMRYYYSHSKRCSEGGLHSIEADDAHKLTLDWLLAIIQDRNRFDDLIEKGRADLNKKLRSLQANLKKLSYEDAALQKKLSDATTQALRQKSSATGDLLEKEAEQILARIQENKRQSVESRAEYEALSAIVNSGDDTLFRSYAQPTKRFLELSPKEKSRRAFQFFTSLTLGDENLNIELAHPNGKLFSGQPVSFIRGSSPLPGILLLRNKAFLARLYCEEKLSTNAIARRINVGQSTVSDALQRHGLADKSNEIIRHSQHVPFGSDFKKGKLIPNRKEKQTIRLIQQLHSTGLSLREIAAHLNRKFIPTKRRGVWDATTVRRVLGRSSP